MHTSRSISRFAFLSVLAFALTLPALAARGPVPVSPGGAEQASAVEARCPTFQWAGVPGARGYELAVFRVAADGAEPVLVTRASVPGDARGFTPAASDCLERGARYAWSIAATGQKLDWSRPHLFVVEAAPSLGELEQAVSTIARYLENRRDNAESIDPDISADIQPRAAPPATGGSGDELRRATSTEQPRMLTAADGDFLPGQLSSGTIADRVVSAADAPPAPTFGPGALSVDDQIHLAADGNVFKVGKLFLWDDAEGNTALGRDALSDVDGTAKNNTALGRNALRNAKGGPIAFDGGSNTAVGESALQANTTGFFNTAMGFQGLFHNTVGDKNTAIGHRALRNNTSYYNTAAGAYAMYKHTTGTRNAALGYKAGYESTTGSNNVFIGNVGVAGDSATIKIGTQGTQLTTFVAGIRGVTTATAAIPVLVSTTGQLGTTSSSRRLKQDIHGVDEFAGRLLDLHPVAFRFKQHVANDPDTPLEFGLIAEEVAEVFPELVVYDEQGRPETVKYHLLSALLLGEVQRLEARLEALESQSTAGESSSTGAGSTVEPRAQPFAEDARGGAAPRR